MNLQVLKSDSLIFCTDISSCIGALLAFRAMVLIVDQNIQGSLIVLTLTAFVDSVGGTLARRVNVTAHTPEIDGALLDNSVDYLTWTFLPVLLF